MTEQSRTNEDKQARAKKFQNLNLGPAGITQVSKTECFSAVTFLPSEEQTIFLLNKREQTKNKRSWNFEPVLLTRSCWLHGHCLLPPAASRPHLDQKEKIAHFTSHQSLHLHMSLPVDFLCLPLSFSPPAFRSAVAKKKFTLLFTSYTAPEFRILMILVIATAATVPFLLLLRCQKKTYNLTLHLTLYIAS